MKKIAAITWMITMVLFSTTKTFSQHGKVLNLDGSSGYMVVANKTELNINTNQSFSITCWANTADYGKRIISKRIAGGGAGYEFINNTSPGGQFGVNLRSTASVNAGPPYGTSSITNSSWHHLAMVVNTVDHTCRIYVDGALQQTSTNTVIGTGSFANTINLFFGTTTSLTPFMKIQMDDIRIWSTALSATAVSGDMTTIVTGTEAGLVAAWNFENVTGTTVPDITTGNIHPGTLNGGASIVSLPIMTYSSTSLLQTELPVGKGDAGQRIIAVKVTTTGSTNPISLNSLSLTMVGTTNITDVTGVKIYYTGTNNRFNTNSLFATAIPASGVITATGNQTLLNGSNYFWITYDVSNAATEGDLLDATCEGITVGGTMYSFVAPNNTVAGSRTVLLTNQLLFSGGDYGSANYRIPAIVTANDSSLVTATDMRINNSGDLPNKINIAIRRSTDKGSTWSAPNIIVDLGPSVGAGDAALVVEKTSGKIICLFATDAGFSASTPTVPIRIRMCSSTNNGVTWTAPIDITNQIYGAGCNNPITKTWYGAFVSSGRAHQLRNGTIVAVLAVRQSSGSQVDNFMISSTDNGITWVPSTGQASTNGNEAKIVELNNGNLLMSIRQPGTRIMNTSANQGASWGTQYNQADLVEPGCNGDFIRFTSTLDGYNKNRLLHSVPSNSTTRKNVSVLVSYDEGTSWTVNKTIFPQASAYSSLTKLPDGTIGLYYENGEYETYQMYFARFSLNWLTNGTDTYTAGITSPQPVAAAPTTVPDINNNTLRPGLRNSALNHSEKIKVALFPNPANQTLNVKISGGDMTRSVISVFNADGRMMIMRPVTQETTVLDITSLINSFYFVNITGINGTILNRLKFVKQ